MVESEVVEERISDAVTETSEVAEKKQCDMSLKELYKQAVNEDALMDQLIEEALMDQLIEEDRAEREMEERMRQDREYEELL